MTTTIRPSRASDREELVRIVTTLWPDATENDVEKMLALPPAEGIVLVAERGDGECGVFDRAETPVLLLDGVQELLPSLTLKPEEMASVSHAH